MANKNLIQTFDNLQIDQFVDCILVEFSQKIEEVDEVFFSQTGEYPDKNSSVQAETKSTFSSFNCIDYDPPHLNQWHRIKKAA